MTDAERLGNNIRNCRELFGESQEELAEILGISKQAVSAYELGNTFPKKDNVFKIAQHFMVTADELMYTNLSENEILKNISYEISFFRKEALYVLFPVFGKEKALSDEHFKRAVNMHEHFYSSIYSNSIVPTLDNCFIEYFLSIDNKEVENEAIANILALWHLLMFTANNGKHTLLGLTALVQKLAKEDQKINKKIIFGPSPQLEANLKEMLDVLTDSRMMEAIESYMIHLKREPNWSYIAEYYYALQYLINITDSGLSADLNRTVGGEMFKVLFSTQNIQACKLFNYILDSISFSKKSTTN